jgi:peptide chain release factor 2
VSSVKNPPTCGGIFDIDAKIKRLDELENQSQNPGIWNDHEQMQKINRERALIEKSVADWKSLKTQLEDAQVLLEMAVEAEDEGTFSELKSEVESMVLKARDLELKSLLRGETDSCSSYLSINSGAGGTEACDWASMLMRMFLRYAEHHGYRTEILAISEGEEAGIKSVTMLIEGPLAYGYLKAENGVHRLVRISPFDSNARRHTSFASVFCWPEVDDSIKIEIREEDLKIDTYRSSGAGGQHVNKTESAVRITHMPTGIVVQCQNQRSQHSNRDKAMKMLKAALYEAELDKREKEKKAAESGKMANEWGSQIRSYVLHPYQLVKDHRTNFESGNPQSVLDGGLDPFIEAYLKNQVLGLS